jgi:hypothetical protein
MTTSTNEAHAGSEVLTKFVISNRRFSREINFRSSTDRVLSHAIKNPARAHALSCLDKSNTKATAGRRGSIQDSGAIIASKAKKMLMTSTQKHDVFRLDAIRKLVEPVLKPRSKP